MTDRARLPLHAFWRGDDVACWRPFPSAFGCRIFEPGGRRSLAGKPYGLTEVGRGWSKTMDVRPEFDLRGLVARRRPGHALEAPFYRSPELFAADLELVFGRHWLFVAVEPELPEPGDVVRVDIGPDSLLILRDDDDQVRAFHNVCRHRGAKLVTESKASVGKLVCPYHQWTYELDGRLLYASQMGESFDASCHGLKPVHLRSIGGLIFICLADTPPADIEDMALALEPRLAPHHLRNTKVAAQIDLVEHGNWKLTMENNRECYHCAAGHPELCMSYSKYSVAYEPDADNPVEIAEYSAWHAEVARSSAAWEAAGFPSRVVKHLTGRSTAFRTERLLIAGDGEAHTLDCKVACQKPLGQIGIKRLGDLHIHTQPNSWHHYFSDHGISFAAFPLDAERTLVRTTWLVHKDAVMGVDYDPQTLIEVWQATNRQDASFVELAQSGVRSRAYEPGPYSPMAEGEVDEFTTWYIERMRAGLGMGPA